MKCPSPVVSHLASPPHLLPTGVMSVKQYKTYFKESFTQCSSFVSRRRLENLYFTSSNDGRGRTRRTEALFVSYLSLCVSRPSLDIWTAPVAAQPSSSTPSTEMCRLLPSCLPALRNANFVDCKTPKWISHSHKVEANWKPWAPWVPLIQQLSRAGDKQLGHGRTEVRRQTKNTKV